MGVDWKFASQAGPVWGPSLCFKMVAFFAQRSDACAVVYFFLVYSSSDNGDFSVSANPCGGCLWRIWFENREVRALADWMSSNFSPHAEHA